MTTVAFLIKLEIGAIFTVLICFAAIRLSSWDSAETAPIWWVYGTVVTLIIGLVTAIVVPFFIVWMW